MQSSFPNSIPNNSNRLSTILIYILVIGCLIRTVAVFQYNPLDWLVSDGLRHWHNAENLFKPFVLPTLDPLAYQVFVWLCRLIFDDSRILWAVTNSILSICFVIFWTKFSLTVISNRSLALLAAVLVCFCPSLIFIFCYPMTETLLLPILGAALWCSARLMEKEKKYAKLKFVTALVGVGLLWGLTLQTRIVALPFALASIAVLSIKRRAYLPVIVIALMIAICALPQTYRTWKNLGIFAPFGGIHLINSKYFQSGAMTMKINISQQDVGEFNYGFQSPALGDPPLAPYSSFSSIRSGEVNINIINKDHSTSFAAEDTKHALLHPKFISLVLESWLHLAFGASWPDGHRNNLAGLSVYYSRWLWAPLLVLSFIVSVTKVFKKPSHYLPILLTIVIATMLIQTTGVMEGRYRKPLEPLLLIAVVAFFDGVTRRKNLELGSKQLLQS